MIQISSDGLNVNFLFLHMIKDNRLTEELPNFHTVHNAFKHSEHTSGWLLKKFLVSLYKISDQTPGRRTDYKNVANAIDKDFPMR